MSVLDRESRPGRRTSPAPRADLDGPQNAIGKVCAVFRVLSSRAPLRLSEIAEATDFNRVTALRILDELVAQRFVSREGKPPRYSLGPEAAAMGSASSLTQDVRSAARPSLVRLAEVSEDTVLLSVRSGTESLCVDRSVGSFPIQANFLHVGSRRPLGVGAGSMALLAWLPEEERESVLDAITRRIDHYPRITREVLVDHIGDAHTRGYVCMLDIVIERIGAIAFPIRTREGEVVAAISIAAQTERIVEREERLAAAIAREVRLIERAIAQR